ncbi:retron Eco8 family effector endonuclease [Priestia megaterium]|uniref:retron Eco8 family effector endonuclease n=1 Tax=Priestia megaterium TaxID=1404 RepID=UPI0031010B5B
MLTRVKLKNCKSIKKLDVKIGKTNCLIGKNGVGKTTFIKSIEFFYEALIDKQSDFTVFDQNNPYNEFAEIELNYDFGYFHKVGENYKFKRLLGEIKSSEFMESLGNLDDYTDVNNQLKIKLLVDKKGNKQWIPNLTFESRKILKDIYPFYFISIKSYEQTNWETLWEMIGDLAKLPKFNLEEGFGTFLEDSTGSSFGKILDIVNRELDDTNVIITPYSNQERFLNILKLQLGGEKLQYKYKDLSFFSDGTNSFNYLKLFCSLVNKIAEQKLKIPLLFLDEPEIGLHPKYIDDLMINLLKGSNKNQIFIATHSSRILKNVIKMTKDYNILHAVQENDYTNLTVVNQFLDHREKNVLSDEEASYYFSNKIVFVEGNTELELFGNENLLELFPFLRDVDFYSFNADTVNLSTIHPKIRNTKIPFLILVDSDYIFEVNDSGFANIKQGTQSKHHLNPLDMVKFKKEHDREYFYFGEKSILYPTRKKINKMCTTYKYSYNKYWFTIYGLYFKKFISLVKKYCMNYNVYPVSTTIEGTLVNANNVEFFKNWLKEQNPYSHENIEKIYDVSKHPSVRASAFRLIVDGKYDTLQKMKGHKITNSYPVDIKNAYLSINTLKKSKTSGWVTNWLDYIFTHYINEKETVLEKEEAFYMYFPELFDIIKRVHKCK